ncbi:MAG: efflux RND transporter periplasmic adaptor subunit [Proteobacteria bacterium]|nr:efflux RND transporter periplasmic adaptor subunit [Pseudomonadota bacterium]
MSDIDNAAAASAPAEAVKHRSWGRRLAAITTILLAAGSAVALYFNIGQPSKGSVTTAPPPAPAVTVSAPLQKEITEWDEFTGQFAAVDYVEIRARVSGYLTEIDFQDGQVVKKGDLLFVIDPRPYEATLAAARAQLAHATAQAELASRQLERSSELRKRDFEAVSNYDQRVSELRVATATVEGAKAAIRGSELNVEFTRIKAPASGRISSHQVSVGNLVSGGEGGSSTLLTTIVSLSPIYFNFDMSESDYLAYQRATAQGKMRSTRDNSVPVFAHLTDEAGWPREGRMDFVDNRVDRNSGTIRARAVFQNPDLLLTPGQFGRIRIPGSEPYQAILIPDAALVTDQSRKLVMTVTDDGTVAPKIVRPGPSYENLRIIRAGLDPSDRIIVNGLMRARPGAKVTPQPGTIELTARAN